MGSISVEKCQFVLGCLSNLIMMIDNWLVEYCLQNEEEIYLVMWEIMQEIVLGVLLRMDFYKKVVFYGGMVLCIFYGFDRFFEDFDFLLFVIDEIFSFEFYFLVIVKEFDVLGMEVIIWEKEKSVVIFIELVFFKFEIIWKELILENEVKGFNCNFNCIIKIKIEIDVILFGKFEMEEKLLLCLFLFYVKCFKLLSLFVGKLYVLLYCKWKICVKGCDWYDLEWYVWKGILLNIMYFLE